MKQKTLLFYKKVKWMFRFVRPYKYRLLLGMLFDILGDGISMLFSAMALEYIANAMLEAEYKGVKTGIIYFLLSYAFMLVFHVLYNLSYGTAVAGIKAGFSSAVFYKLLKSPLLNISHRKIEDQITYLNQDIDLCLRMYTEDLKTLLKCVMMGVIVLTSIMQRNILVGLFCFVIFLGNIIGNLYFTPKQEKAVTKRQQSLAKLNGIYNDLFAGAMVIKLSRLKIMMMERVEEAAKGVSDAKKAERKLTLKQDACTNLFLYMSMILPLLVSTVLAILGKIAFGSVFFIKQLTDIYLYYCNSLGVSIMNLSKCQAGMNRIYDMLKESDEIDSFGSLVTRKDKELVLDLNHIKITYGEKIIIKDFSLQIHPNETVALVGSSGSGKSTLIKAIIQLVSFEGTMKLYGENVKDFSLEYLRNQFAYVEQEAKLFDGTIYDNIVYGNVTATEDEVYLAAQKAYADEFILNLPNGYDTIIGENGYKLSGGERQRVAIARAFLKNAPILLLDEATSALDSESEQKVQLAIEELMKGRTILVVAHRLSTIQHADRIIVLEHGDVVEEGDHNELLHQEGRYQELYQLQFLG